MAAIFDPISHFDFVPIAANRDEYLGNKISRIVFVLKS